MDEELAVRTLSARFLEKTIRRPETPARLRPVMKDFSCWYFKQEDPRLPLNPSAADRLNEIRVPTLIVTAEHDIPACLEFAELRERRIPHSRKVSFPEVGHFMMVEAPEAFNRALLDFFANPGQ